MAEEQNAEAISQMAENTAHINDLIKQAKELSKNLSESSEAGSSEVQKTELPDYLHHHCRPGTGRDCAGAYRRQPPDDRRRVHCRSGGRCPAGAYQYQAAEHVPLRAASHPHLHRELYLLDHHDRPFPAGRILLPGLVTGFCLSDDMKSAIINASKEKDRKRKGTGK